MLSQKCNSNVKINLYSILFRSYNVAAVKSKILCLPVNAKQDVADYMKSVDQFMFFKITDWSYVVK